MQMHDQRPYCAPDAAPVAARRTGDSANAYAEWKAWRSDDFGHPTPEACAYFDALWRRFVGTGPAPLKMLEVGFGNGQFIGWCRQRGMAVWGIETSEALLARARNAGFDCVGSLDMLDDTRFDLIVLFDVLEHLQEARITPLLASLSNRLASGGRIILRTPNGGSPFGLNHQYGDPTHASVLTPNKLRFLCAPAGLAISYCGADLRPLRAVPVAKWPARLLRLLLSRLLERLVRFVFAPQPRGVLSPNLLTVLHPSAPRRPRAAGRC